MLRYVGRRLLSGLLTLFLFVSLMFFLVNVLLPGDWATQFILTADQGEALRDQLGLDQPLWRQYLTWVSGIFTLDLGESYGRGEVWDALMAALPSTLLVLMVGLSLAFLLGGWMGRVAAHEDRSLLTWPMTFISILFLTIFPPVLAVLLEQGFLGSFGHMTLGIFGTIDEQLWADAFFGPGDALSPPQVLWRMVVVLLVTIVGLWVLERVVSRLTRARLPRWLFLVVMVLLPIAVWSMMGLGAKVVDLAGTLALLLVGVVLLTFGDVMLVTRAAMDDTMLEDYVMVARAKGLPERDVRDHHAARVALLPVLSRFTVSIPYFLTGLIILEAAFSGAGVAGVGFLQRVTGPEGLGSVLFEAVRLQDTFLIVGGLLLVGLLTVLLRVALDVVHAALDPRLRLGGDDGR